MVIKLRPDQQEVARYRGGYMAVPAVPGAGKTTVLAHLTADLITEGAAAPGRVLIVTYTNSAVGNFRSRIGDLLAARGFGRGQGYEVRTIHSLAMSIVRERPEGLLWSDNFTICPEHVAKQLLLDLTRTWVGGHRERWLAAMKPEFQEKTWYHDKWLNDLARLVGRVIQALKNARLTPEGAAALAERLSPDSLLSWAIDIYGQYQAHLAAMAMVDFADLVQGAHALLAADPELLERLRQRWTYIFEDEAQDSYRLQEQLLRLLAGPGGNFVRVGDSNQAITGTFSGAEPEQFRAFCAEPGVSVRPLTMAGRSSPDIIDLANELVAWAREQHPEPPVRDALAPQLIVPVPADLGFANPQPAQYTIVTRVYETEDEELCQVAQLAARSVQRAADKTLAILVPRNDQVDRLLQMLERLEVPARPVKGAEPQGQTAEDLLVLLEFLARPHEPQRLVTVLCARLRVPPEEAPFADYLRRARVEEIFFPGEGVAPYADLYAAVPGLRGWTELERELDDLRRWLTWVHLPADELLVTIASDMALAGEELAIAHYLAGRARRFLQEYPDYGLPEVVQDLRADMAATGRFAQELFDRKGFKAEPGVVYVVTCHSAKGLEWDTVYVCSLTKREFPGTTEDATKSDLWYLHPDLNNPEAVALAELKDLLGEDPGHDPVYRAKLESVGERLRLLYVAITRARENLFLSAHREYGKGKTTGPTLAFRHLADFAAARRQQHG
jgi:DNA helicase-2/ATP-dependent DNA helicase PcrA